MAGNKCQGPLGCATNQPLIDAGTLARNRSNPPAIDGPQWRAVEMSEWEIKWQHTKEWFSEVGEATNLFGWFVIGSPATAGAADGDMEFGPGDSETRHMRDTPAYQEALAIYKEWVAAGRPFGRLNSDGTVYEFVPEKGYLYVAGRTGAGRSPRGHWYEPLKHPLWGYTGNFAVRFTETGYPKEGHLSVEIENYTSLPSYLHGIAQDNKFLDSLYTKRPGIPILSRSRQIYKFMDYVAPIAPVTVEASYTVAAGDTLSALAGRLYGDMGLWPILYEKNQGLIGPDPDRVEVGMVLVVPAKEQLAPEQVQRAKLQAAARRAMKVPPAR